jgi:hypothetical protein
MSGESDLKTLYPFLRGQPRALAGILWDLVHTLLADDRGSAKRKGTAA